VVWAMLRQTMVAAVARIPKGLVENSRGACPVMSSGIDSSRRRCGEVLVYCGKQINDYPGLCGHA
jgi:hypothetical protein